jgi:hypothetical protein
MRVMRCGAAVVVAAVLAVSSPVGANNNPNGLAFRAVGWYKGKAEISENTIRCEIPSTSTAIGDGAFSLGLWNTFGVDTLQFPDPNNAFANPCGVWIQLHNNLIDQGIQVLSVTVKVKVAGARRFRQFVPTRTAFPVACRYLKKQVLFTGIRLNPVNSTQPIAGTGAPNVGFIQMLPMLPPEMIHCLRTEYVGRASSAFTSLVLVARAVVKGISDSGDTFRSNAIPYTVTLRHSCGNGRVDDGEVCDPAAVGSTCVGVCSNGTCSQSTAVSCTSDADCQGACVAADDPSECTCLY